ncbi:hypothetical protein Daus18300_012631 [Diaporthe australafricana]|uniref:Uncharacterized protein n=1 Tax=Diaporthe australafricana TaxID=127596 RepID=A0ABR3W288_9PEZI
MRCPHHRSRYVERSLELEERQREQQREQDRREIEERAQAIVAAGKAYRQNTPSKGKPWIPTAQGVATVRGDLIPDFISFFRDCEITLRERDHSAADRRRHYTDTGEEFIKNIQVLGHFMEAPGGVETSIEKFQQPADMNHIKHPDEAALSNMQGPHSRDLCALILYFGCTGERESGEIDEKCSYILYNEKGWNKREWHNLDGLGEKPFNMVRLSNEPCPNIYEIMLRLGIKLGKDRAKAFHDKFNENVMKWDNRPESFENYIYTGSQESARQVEQVEQVEEVQEAGNAGSPDFGSNVSALTDLSDQFAEDD